MPRHLVLRLEGPLLSFGAEAIDNFGVVRDFPAASMLVGLMANALGWRREDREAHQNLQDRLVFAARRDREGSRFTEFQTAQLDGGAQHWTTRGAVEGRRGGADTYKSPHLRYRDHDADAAVTVCFASSRRPTRQISTRLRMPCNIPRVHCFWAENPAFRRSPWLPATRLLRPTIFWQHSRPYH